MGRCGLSWPPHCSALGEGRGWGHAPGVKGIAATLHGDTAHSSAWCSTGHPGPPQSVSGTRFRIQSCASRRSHQSGRLQSESGAARLPGVPGGPPGAAGRCRSWPANQCTCTHASGIAQQRELMQSQAASEIGAIAAPCNDSPCTLHPAPCAPSTAGLPPTCGAPGYQPAARPAAAAPAGRQQS